MRRDFAVQFLIGAAAAKEIPELRKYSPDISHGLQLLAEQFLHESGKLTPARGFFAKRF